MVLVVLLVVSLLTLIIYYKSGCFSSVDDAVLLPIGAAQRLYTKNDLPLLVYYEYCEERHSNLGNEYAIIEKAIRHINDSTGFTFFKMTIPGLRPENMDDVLIIRDVRGKHDGCKEIFDGPFGVLAHSYYPPTKKICIDNEEPWTNRQLRYALIHELLHSLGMRHIDAPDGQKAIMQQYYDKSINSMQPLDIYHLRRLYPFI